MAIRAFESIQPVIHETAYIDDQSCIIGNVTIGADSSIWPMAVLRGDVNRIEIGQRCSIQDGAVMHGTHQGPYTGDGHATILGNDVTVGHQATLHGCTIGHRVLVGMGAKVLDGAKVHDEVMIGAGSLVASGKILASGYLYVGTPAKPVRPLTEKEREYLSYTTAHYVRLHQRHQQA